MAIPGKYCSVMALFGAVLISSIAWAKTDPDGAAQRRCVLNILNDEGAITTDSVDALRDKVDNLPAATRKLQRKAQVYGMDAMAINEDIIKMHNENPFYTKVLPEGPIADQAQSGRCWLESYCNVLINRMIKLGKLPPGFQVSRVYGYFFSEYEKSNTFMIDFIKKLKPDAETQSLLRSMLDPNAATSINDGGYSNYDEAIISKYGMVPESAMPETANSRDTSEIADMLKTQYTEASVAMMDKYKSFGLKKGQQMSEAQVKDLLTVKDEYMAKVYQKLAARLGNPPKTVKLPGGPEMTPIQLAKEVVGFNPKDYVVISAYPTLDEGKNYHVVNGSEQVGKINGSRFGYQFLNVSRDRIYQLMKKSIDQGHTIWMGSDFSHDVDEVSGIMHPKIFNRSTVEGLEDKDSMNLSVAEKIRLGLTSVDHATAVIGYDEIAPGKFRKWLVENSWGEQPGTDGNFHMYQEWADENMFQVVVPRSSLSLKELKLLNAKPVRIGGAKAP